MSLPIGKSAPVNAVAADAKGIPTGEAFDGPLSWSVSDPSLAELDVAEDGLSAVLKALQPGSVVVNASGKVKGLDVSGSLSVDMPDVSTQILLSLGPVS